MLVITSSFITNLQICHSRKRLNIWAILRCGKRDVYRSAIFAEK